VTFSLRKEVIQPQVLLRLPCYDFTPIMNHTLDGYLPCGLVYRLLVQSTFVM
jgi:sulfite exporter TauE/SafE